MKKYKTNLPFQIHGTSMFQDGLSEGKIGRVVEGNFTRPFVDQGDPEWENTKVKSSSKQKKMMKDPWCFYAKAVNNSHDDEMHIFLYMISKWNWGGDDAGDIGYDFGLGNYERDPEGFNKKWEKGFHNPTLSNKRNRPALIKAMAKRKEYITQHSRKMGGGEYKEYHGTGPDLKSLIKSMKDLYNHEKQDSQPPLKRVSSVDGVGPGNVQDFVNPEKIAPAKYPG